MSSNARILITGTGSCGVGEGIFKCLHHHIDLYEIHCANANTGAVPLFRSHKGHVLPSADDSSYVEAVSQLCRDEKIDFLIPGSEAELSVLAPLIDEFALHHVRLLCNPPEVINVGDDKLASSEFLSKHGFDSPRSFAGFERNAVESLGFPLIAKPRSGSGSKHVYVVQSPEHLDLVESIFRFHNLDGMVQECVGEDDSEYTASALTDDRGRLIGTFAARRTLIGGATGTVEVEEFSDVRDVAARIAEALEVRGPVNIQCRIHGGRVSVFEINPRFSGSAPFRSLAGFNEPHLLIQSIMTGKCTLDYHIQTGTWGVRGFEEMLFDRRRLDNLVRWPR